jgi:ATP-dependent exoDNAse (exonuclease V) alpha subunit
MLNDKQLIAFRIASQQFQTILVESKAGLVKFTPLWMFITGPGGTGKTHLVNALKELMKRYGCGHRIYFLAPTGGAAGLIGGETIHTGLGIKIHSKGVDKGSKYGKDLNVEIPLHKREELQTEWKNVDFLLIDEVSMVSAELLCELDAVLCYAKECDDWFGGINIIFSGDFYQFTPVRAQSLYVPITSKKTRQSKTEEKA